uniref:Uncharacterized protein n=1 Tax=Meloidogyne incognita TaxID=6306 RepID=A0A914NCJ1_MELIC
MGGVRRKFLLSEVELQGYLCLTENSGKKTVRQKNVGFLQFEESRGADLIVEREILIDRRN